MTQIIIIAAVAKNGVIGRDEKIPWRIKEDLKHFKKLTFGYPVIMGRKTWESLPTKPLKGRLNIVLTRKSDFNPEHVVVKHSLEDALDYCKNQKKVFIIGGESVYRESLRFADKLEITRVNKDFEGDTHFPKVNWNEWELKRKKDRNGFSFLTYVRKDM